MTAFLQDLRIALRSLAKNRGFALTALCTLGLGMTLCTTAVVTMKAYLLQDLPYPSSERLYAVRYGAPGAPGPQGMQALDWSALDEVIEHRIAWDLDMFYMLGTGHAEAVPGAWVTPGFVDGLAIRPAVGSGFDEDAFAPGGDNVVLISHRLWNSRFGADPDIVGRTFAAYVSDRPEEAERFRIVGVLPASFWHINTYTDILAPLRARTYPYLVRLKTGVTPQQASARIASLVRGGARNVPTNWEPALVLLHAQYVERTRPLLWTASAAASLVLLVACANVAALLLVRAIGRQKELAIRSALGAGRRVLTRMLLAEALVLGGAATLLSVFASGLIVASLAPALQQQLGRSAPGGATAFAIDPWTIAFSAAVGLVTAVICTLAPLVTSMRPGIQQALQSAGRSATEAPASRRLRSTLIGLEVALSLTLLAGSTLVIRSLTTLLGTDLGFTAERVLTSSITLRQNRYPDASSRVTVFERIDAALDAIPGIEAVGLTTAWPVQQPRLEPVQAARAADRGSVQTGVHAVSHGYFSAMDIALVEGRAFSDGDGPGSEPVAIVSETLAHRLWPGGTPIGARIVVSEGEDREQPIPAERLVVGVVRDVRQGPTDTELADLYLPMPQRPGRFAFVLLRTAGEPAGWVPLFRAAFREIDPEISVHVVRPLQTIVDELTTRPRFLASLLGAFGLVASLLALVGVYGVIAYAIRQREREIAVRMALGADASRLTAHFVGQGSRILGAGLALGVVGAIAAGRVIESQLFGVSPTDPAALGAALTAFACAGLLAIWWPSRRAAATDPAVALRQE